MQVLSHSHEQKANKQKANKQKANKQKANKKKEPQKELRKKVKHATILITILLYQKQVKKSNNE